MAKKNDGHELGKFEKGIDFLQYFSRRTFTIDDIKDRYSCSYRQALRLRDMASARLNIVPAGFTTPEHPKGSGKFLWEIRA